MCTTNMTKLTPIQQCPCHSDVSQLGSGAGQSVFFGQGSYSVLPFLTDFLTLKSRTRCQKAAEKAQKRWAADVPTWRAIGGSGDPRLPEG